MALEIGLKPKDLTIWLSPGGRFTATLSNWDRPPLLTDGTLDPAAVPLPWGMAVELRFPDAAVAPWTAVVTDNQAVFSVDPAQVDALLATELPLAVLVVGDTVWGRGRWKVGVQRG